MIAEEVDKLIKSSFIREVIYPDWLANVIFVKSMESGEFALTLI